MTIPPRGAAAAAALVLAGTLTAACGSGDQSSGAPTAASPSSPSSTARSTGPTGGSSTSAPPSGRASSSPLTGDGSSVPTGDRQEDKAEQQKAEQQKADRKKAERKQADRHRKQVRERKRLINACVHDTKTLNEAVSTYNTAVSSGDEDDLDYAAAVLREAAGTVDHQAERAGNHRLTRLSDRVVDDLGTIASLLEQGEDVPSSSGDSLTRHSRKLHSYCSGKL